MARLVAIPGGRSEVPRGSPAAAREPGLLAELYGRHAAAVLARCRWLLRDDDAARDATQEVFAKALRGLDEFRGAASPTTWLLSIATRHCLNELRAARPRWLEEERRLAELRRVDGIEPERRELVRALLGRATAEEQEIAVMYFVDELTQAEIAAATGRSLPTVRKRLRGFLAAARGALARAFPGIRLPEEDDP